MITDEEIASIKDAAGWYGGCKDGQMLIEQSQVVAILQRLDAAEAIVAKLPVTADKVPVVPGMVMFALVNPMQVMQVEIDPIVWPKYGYRTRSWAASSCYSTESAARAASAASPGAQGGTEGAVKP